MRKFKFKLKMPHTYVIISAIVVLAAIVANVIPAGEFSRVVDETGREVVVPGSFTYLESVGCSFFDVFVSVQQGFISGAQIIFFIIFAYAFVYMLIKNGTFDAVIGLMLRKIGNNIHLIIPLCMLTFGLLGSTMGMSEETYGLLPVFISIACALGYDAIVGGSIVYVAVSVGFACATLNPFTIGVAQQVAGVPLYSGLEYRILIFVIYMTVAIAYVWHYANKVKKDPTKSILYGTDIDLVKVDSQEELIKREMTTVQKISCLLFVGTVVMLVYGTIQLGWYIDQIAGLFILMMIVVGLISGFSPSRISEYFIEAAKDMMYGALIVGLSRAIPTILENAMIIDTIVYWLSQMLMNFQGIFSAIGMLFVQNVINFFIPSGGGQALVTMPILAPVAEMVGLSRQIAVLAYQLGDGFSNIFWPTSVFMMCGIMRIPINKWYRYITPLFLICFVIEIILLSVAVLIGY